MDVHIRELEAENFDVLRKLFNTAYFVCKEEMSFSSFPSLIRLQKKNGSDLKRLGSYCNDQACRRFVPFLAEAVREKINETISDAEVLTVLYDGATDASVGEVEIVYVRVIRAGEVKEFFCGLTDIEHAHAQGVFQAVDKALTDKVGENWKAKLIGAGSDGARVNIGRNNSVATRMQEDREYVVIGHCVSHRLEIGVVDAIRDNPYMAIVQDMLKKIYKHYHYSPKALRELRAIAESLDETVLKPTRLGGTRWTPHLNQALKKLVKSYNVILAHFEHVSEGGPGAATAEVKGRAKFLTTKLRDWRVLRFIFFMQDMLDVISRLSLDFQKADATCVDFLDSLERANLELVMLQQQPGESLQTFIDELQIDANNQCKYRENILSHYNPDQGFQDLQRVVDSVMNRINGRLENQNDPSKRIFQAARIFDLKIWPQTRNGLAAFGNAEIRVLADHFAPVLARMECAVDALQHEWAGVKAHFGQRLARPDELPKMSSLLRTHRNRDDFKNILMLVEIVFVLPVSSSVCERGFSAVKRIKSDWRSSLTTQMMNHLLTISIEGESTDDYVADRAVQLWWEGGDRHRRPQFLPANMQAEDENEDDEDELRNYLLGVEPQPDAAVGP